MRLTPTALRADLYQILDRVLETGEPIEIERNGRLLRIAAVERPSRLAALIRRPDFIVGDSEDLVHMDWSSEWRP